LTPIHQWQHKSFWVILPILCNHGIINAILRQAEREGLDRPADSHGRIASGLGGFSTFFDVMSRNACAMMHHPIHDVQKDWIS